MNNEFEKLGIDVSDDEFFELITRSQMCILKLQRFLLFKILQQDSLIELKLLGYLKQIDQDQTGDARTRWVGFQKYLIGLIKTSKYNALVNKAMYVTDEEARIDFNSNSQNVTFNYVAIPFTSVDDADVEPTESELNTYYNNHKEDYTQDASKDVDFVVYSVVPSVEDDATTKAEITDLVADFEIFEDYELMARRNSDNTNSRFIFTTEDGLQDQNWKEFLMQRKVLFTVLIKLAKVFIRIAKLAAVQNRADSVEARHILIKPTQTMSMDSVNKKIDALKLAIEAGADFADLAQKNSEDKGSAIKGGDLGWFSEGAMVDEFNEACFTSNRGDLTVVTSQFGVHLN